ncbi:MAG: ATP-binding protein [Clostridia bacterium]|nr:ATP-binding protein [Clostridia bacterium]
MKHTSKISIPSICLSVILSLILCAVSAIAVFYYTYPMEDKSYNLSLLAGDGQEWEGEKGWTVYSNQQGKVKNLISNGFGGYDGLDYAGQTFYFSREMTETLDSPALRIGVANRSISVFLDNSLIYTDCPDADNRIGYLELPMLEFDKSEPVVVSLPLDYVGHTLTIAQSTPLYSEKQGEDNTVYPCEVTLYCGYSYESGLIADTARTMIPAVLLFALEILLMIAFVLNATLGNKNAALPVLATAAFFQMCGILAQASFFYQYFKLLPIDPVWLSFHLSVGALLIFITIKSKRLRWLLVGTTILQWCSIALYCIIQCTKLIEYGDAYVFIINLPQYTDFVSLLAVLVGSFIQWNKGSRFFRHFSVTALIVSGIYTVFFLISLITFPDYAQNILNLISGDISTLVPDFTLKLIWNLCLFSGVSAIIIELVENETTRRTENAVLTARNELAMESYENLCRQSEEIMMLRHDAMKHYTLMQTMAQQNPEQLPAYLEQLIGQMKEIRPVVQSGNQMLDIIINGKLGIAADKGIEVEIIRSKAPEKLPLTNTQLCSLITNILDNAIDYACSSESEKPYIKLDFHCKNNNFIFLCENTMNPDKCQIKQSSEIRTYKRQQKIPMAKHGYGLKIIRRIMKNFNDMVSIETNGNIFKISVIIPYE